jgi:tetratricopeptide (TPR) repeat protein
MYNKNKRIERLVRKVILGLIVISIFYFNRVACLAENLLKNKESLKANSTEARSYYNLGLSFYAQGDFQKAIYNFKEAKERYLQQGDYQKALEIENYLNALTIKEAFEEVNRKIDSLSERVGSLEKSRNSTIR